MASFEARGRGRQIGQSARITVAVVLVWTQIVAGQVVITEVMYDPSGDDGWGAIGGNTEFVEILNVGVSDLNMATWGLRDSQMAACQVNPFADPSCLVGTLGGPGATTNGDLILRPGEYAILMTQDDASGHAPSVANFVAAWNVPAHTVSPTPVGAEVISLDGYRRSSNVQLRNSATDTPIFITDELASTVLDSATYPDGTTGGACMFVGGGCTFSGGGGESQYICTTPLPTQADNDLPGAWVTSDPLTDPIPNPGAYDNGNGGPGDACVIFCSGDAGTPGRANPPTCPCPVLAAIRSVSTAPLVVRQGQVDILVFVSIENLTGLNVNIAAVVLGFRDSGMVDVSAEYIVTPDPANPAVIPPGASVFLVFEIDVDSMATRDSISIDASGQFEDGGLCVTNVSAADAGDSWTVIDCLPGGVDLCGDCDGDNRVTINDALLVARTAAGLALIPALLEERCDVNADIVITIIDALHIAQHKVGLRDPLLCCSRTGGAGLSPRVDDLIFSEFMPQPSVGDANGEWFELRNVSALMLDLQGVEFQVGLGTMMLPTGSSIPLPAGAHFVVSRNSNPGVNGGVIANFLWSGFDLDDAGETLIARFGATILHDFSYDLTWPAGPGLAAQLDPSTTTPAAAQLVTNWCAALSTYGVGDRGTPGSANTSCAPVPPSTGDILVCEFMAAPLAPAMPDDGEYVEVKNVSGLLLDLGGVTLRTDSGSFTLPTGPIPFLPGARFTFAANGNPVMNGGHVPDAVWPTGTVDLDDATDTLRIELGATPIHAITYDTAWPLGAGTGVGLDESVTLSAAAILPGWWCQQTTVLSGGDSGTPEAVNDVCDNGRPPTPGEVIISEAMVEPGVGAVTGDGEWIEVKNVSGENLDLRGMLLDVDGFTAVVNSAAPLTVPPDGHFVIGKTDDTGFNGGWSSGLARGIDYELWSTLGTTLGDAMGTLVISWGGLSLHTISYGVGWPLTPSEALQLDAGISSGVAASLPANWCSATMPYGGGGTGTPAIINELCMGGMGCVGAPPPMPGQLVISELHADPDPGIAGDANGDGTRHSSQDEFIEVVNISGLALDLSGLEIDDLVTTRHTVPMGTCLNPGQALVVFGGGTPTGGFGGSVVQTSSTGLLGFNNGGDTITLVEPMSMAVVDTYAYGSEGGDNQSLLNWVEPMSVGMPGGRPMVKHLAGPGPASGLLYSPGTKEDGATGTW